MSFAEGKFYVTEMKISFGEMNENGKVASGVKRSLLKGALTFFMNKELIPVNGALVMSRSGGVR